MALLRTQMYLIDNPDENSADYSSEFRKKKKNLIPQTKRSEIPKDKSKHTNSKRRKVYLFGTIKGLRLRSGSTVSKTPKVDNNNLSNF